ncbi:hypothetical protein [Paenibacillus hamazuiensis]|uniref:hypothetical protein n=1 Tax=Paenibacillus hamazuiensis TaxID=2936508 RepID=UPI00200F5245|nr:hypothetical protein [Paenibacillus hamazuiensis]
MEKKLVKGAVYSFVLSFLLGLLVFPDTDTVHTGSVVETRIILMREYLFEVIRFSIKMMFGTIVVIWLFHMFKFEKSEALQFISGFVKSFVIVFALIILVVVLFSIWW